MVHHRASGWTERTTATAPGDVTPADDIEQEFKRRGFQRPTTSLGVAGHWLHMLGVFIPVVAGELVSDAAKYKKTVRLASVGVAVGYEVLYTIREQQRHKEQEAKLVECQTRE